MADAMPRRGARELQDNGFAGFLGNNGLPGARPNYQQARSSLPARACRRKLEWQASGLNEPLNGLPIVGLRLNDRPERCCALAVRC